MEGNSENINNTAHVDIVKIADLVTHYLGNDVTHVMEEKSLVEAVLERQEVQPAWDKLKFGTNINSDNPEGVLEANPVISDLMDLTGPIIHKFQVRISLSQRFLTV